MGIFDKITSVLPVIGSVSSTLLGNSKNIQLAREQREWDYKMWKENNEYNTPLNQMNRLRDAGINPGLAMSNGLLSSGVSSQSSGGETAPVTDFSPISQGINNSVDLYQQKRMQDAQISNLNEQTVNQSIKNRYENQRQIIELDRMLSEKGLTNAQRDYYSQERDRLIEENKWIDKRNTSQIHKTMMEAFQSQENGRYHRVLTEYQKLVNEFTPREQEKVLRNLDASYSEIMSAAFHNNASAVSALADEALKKAQKDGVNIDNRTKERIQNSVVKKAFEEAEMVHDDNERRWLEEIHQSTGKAGEYLPSAGRSYYSQKAYQQFINKRRFRK